MNKDITVQSQFDRALPTLLDKDSTVQSQPARTLPTWLDVAAWETRRCWASNVSRLLMAISFGLFLLFTFLNHYAGSMGSTIGGTNVFLTFQIAGDSAWGVVDILSSSTFLLAILLPFLNTSGVAHDLKDRTHELLMTTPVSTRAYVLGRYLFYLLASLGLALLLLITLLLISLLFYLIEPGYPLPQVGFLLLFWLIAILPIVILLSSVSFALGTIWPRHTQLVAAVPIVALLLFIVALMFLPPTVTSSSGSASSSSAISLPWYQLWEPTNIGMEEGLQQFYGQKESIIFNVSGNQVNPQQIQAAFQTLTHQQPDLSPWLLPHLIWASFGVAAALGAAWFFKRFRNVIQ